MSKKDTKLSRRELLKSAGLAGAGLGIVNSALGEALSAKETEYAVEPQAAYGSMIGERFKKHGTVRLGIVGVGLRGTSVLGEFLGIDKVQVVAVCDIVKDKCLKAAKKIEKAGQKTPTMYFNGERDFESLCKRDDLDFIYTATPWEWHVPVMLAALQNGHHCGSEVPVAYTIADCWKLVDASEKSRRHCMIMENCCYAESEMMILNMVRAGLLGELVHGECAYNHDLREILFEDKDEGLWRRRHHTLRDANLYTTHGLGPVANYMSINRGDKFDYMVSMSSAHLGLEAYREDHLPKSDPKWKEVYKCGDYNTSMIKTAKGRTIMLQHNVTSPRPYDRINLIQGTKGIFRDYPARIYVDGQKEEHRWTSLDSYREKFEHPLWKKEGETARQLGGHGGMDYIMCYRLIECMREGLVPDMDVYDAAAWSVPGPLSELSVAKGSMPLKFPDFTRGRWKDAL
jgi:predicted dehydrogenase